MNLKKTTLSGLLVFGLVAGSGAASAASYTTMPAMPGQNSLQASLQNSLQGILQRQGGQFGGLFGQNPQGSNPNLMWPGMLPNMPGNGNGMNHFFPSIGGIGGNQHQPTCSTPPTAPTDPSIPVDNPGTPTTEPVASPEPSTPSTPSTPSSDQSAYANQVVNLVNQERAKAGLKPLTADSALSNMALDKAKDMYNNHYFDHTSPTYGSPFDMMQKYGISYSYAGENIAMGQQSPQEVMTSWMNSEGHRQNILSPNYTKIGVGYYNNEWVQEFIAN